MQFIFLLFILSIEPLEPFSNWDSKFTAEIITVWLLSQVKEGKGNSRTSLVSHQID